MTRLTYVDVEWVGLTNRVSNTRSYNNTQLLELVLFTFKDMFQFYEIVYYYLKAIAYNISINIKLKARCDCVITASG